MDYLNTDFGVDSSIRFLFRARTDAQSGYKSLSQRILSGGVKIGWSDVKVIYGHDTLSMLWGSVFMC